MPWPRVPLQPAEAFATMATTVPSLTDLFRQFRPGSRMWWLVAAAALLVLGELGLRAWEQHQKLDAELQRVRRNVAALNASNDGADWVGLTRSAEAARAQLRTRLWQVPSEAQAQARLRDWLSNALRSAGAVRPAINLMPTTPATVAPTNATAPSATTSATSAAVGLAQNTLRARASVSFELAPSALENALVQIEAGGQLASIENITVSTRSRRIEMTVSVPVMLKDKP
jgi:hypothetical protein